MSAVEPGGGAYAAGPSQPPPEPPLQGGQGAQAPQPPPPQAAAPQPPSPGVNGQTFGEVRDRLFYALFVRAALSYAKFIPPALRRLFEFFFLLKAVSLLGLLVYVHMAFNRSPATCLLHVKDVWPRDGVLRIEILRLADAGVPVLPEGLLSDWFDDGRACVWDGPRERLRRLLRLPRGALGSEPLHDLLPSKDLPELAPTEEGLPGTKPEELEVGEDPPAPELEQVGGGLEGRSSESPEAVEELDESVYYTEGSQLYYYEHALEYALEFGFLRLSTKTREKLGVKVLTVRLDPETDACFGQGLSRLLLSELLGYEDLLMASVKALAENQTNKGYLRNLMTGEHFRFVSSWMGQGSYIAAFAVMLVFTFSISMLLRFSHHQIFVFIIDLLQMLELNQALAFPAAPLLTVILALVGMEAIMSEFFADSSTAFYVILMVWVGDQYDAVCCHAAISKRHWLRFFFLYQWAFYAYHYRFNGQYSGLALLTNWLFLQHSMLYFFHHYELPLILHQQRVQRVLHNLHSHPHVTGRAAATAPAQPPAPPPDPAIGRFADDLGDSALSEALDAASVAPPREEANATAPTDSTEQTSQEPSAEAS